MPTYGYECPACGNAISITRSIFADDPGYDCPNEECGTTLVRVYDTFAISLKGGGFYSTGG